MKMGLIDKQAATTLLRGKCVAKYPSTFLMGLFAAADEIAKLPVVDAVEVVHCQNCKYWTEGRHHTGRCNALVQFHDAERYMTDAGHFCSYGERKANG